MNLLASILMALLALVQAHPELPQATKLQVAVIELSNMQILSADQQGQVTSFASATLSEEAPPSAPAPSQESAPAPTAPEAPVPQAPACTLSAPVVAWRTTWHAQFAWTHTPGATAVIVSSGSPVPLNIWSGQAGSVYADDSPHQAALYAPAIFQDADYEMDVTLNGLTGSCLAHATVPPSPPSSN